MKNAAPITAPEYNPEIQFPASLRDWFAGKAPPIPEDFPTERYTAFVGDAQNPKDKSSCPVGSPIGPAEKFTDSKRAAVWAYQYADAMLAERAREKSESQ